MDIRYLWAMLFGFCVVLSFVSTMRYLIKVAMYLRRLEVWRPYVERLT